MLIIRLVSEDCSHDALTMDVRRLLDRSRVTSCVRPAKSISTVERTLLLSVKLVNRSRCDSAPGSIAAMPHAFISSVVKRMLAGSRGKLRVFEMGLYDTFLKMRLGK